MDAALIALRERAPGNELDYGFVMDCLKDYSNPRGKLTRLLKSGALIRLKKGLYVFGRPYQRGDLSMTMLANMIYGPSYVSLEWALGHYGLIPERVEEVTSITVKRKARFDTPIGRFTYEHSNLTSYPIGLTRFEESKYQSALIATKEKAVADQLIVRRGKVTSLVELEQILFEDFRIEEEDVAALDISVFERIVSVHSHSALFYLIKLIKRLRHE
jgi:hypothetical protein